VALTIESFAELSHRVNSAHLQGKGNANIKVDGAERLGEKLKLAFPQGRLRLAADTYPVPN
jgi:hypothetical protein